jgi:O-antigen ligase
MFIKNYFNNATIQNNPNLLINFIFAFFPISFILGNLFLTLNLILFCCLGIYQLKSKIFKIKLNFIIKIILLFFGVIFFSTALSLIQSLYLGVYDENYLERFLKSILLFRFFLMLLIIYLLNEYNILNFKYFFFSSAYMCIIVSLDIIFQYIMGFNLIGLKSQDVRNSGFFGEELVAGIFILRFSIFPILYLAFKLRNKNNYRYIFTTVLICILGTAILFSGNRMPMTLFLFGLFVIFLFDIKIKKIIAVNFISLFLLLVLITSSNEILKKNYMSYYMHAKTIVAGIVPNFFKKNLEETNEALIVGGGYWKKTEKGTVWKELTYPSNFQNHTQRLFLTAIDTWKMNKLFGNGMRSFKIDCRKLATPVSSFTEEEERKFLELVKSGKIAESDAMVLKLLEKQVGVPGVVEVNMTETFIKFKKNRLCSSHPHNYYLEILTETGILGFLITLIIAIVFFIFILKNYKFFKINYLGGTILLAAIISLILELFPLKTTGTLFSISNATYIIIISSIVLCYKNLFKDNNR